MTTVFFVRHAEPNYENHDDLTRELSPRGLRDRRLVTEFFRAKDVDAVLSSPFQRAVDTVAELARERGLAIRTVEDFRERRIDDGWIEDFDAFCERQWSDFSYRLASGESLGEVQSRSIGALEDVLREYPGKTVVIGSHGTALSTVIRYYNGRFGYADFAKIKKRMPWVVEFDFDGAVCVRIQSFDLFENRMETLFSQKREV